MKIPNPTTAGATTAAVVVLKDLLMLRGTLQQYHPLVIEGHTRDTRDPSLVADRIVHNLQQRWEQHNMTKPILLLSQGDPLTERGISAITRHVATSLGLQRCLVCLDAEIDPHHSTLADRQDVLYEMKYSQLLEVLQSDHHDYDDEQKKYTTNTDTCTDTTTNTKGISIGVLTNEVLSKRLQGYTQDHADKCCLFSTRPSAREYTRGVFYLGPSEAKTPY